MKKALIVGINQYATQKDLRGCVNDANLMRSVLATHCQFEEISVITDDIDKPRLLEALTNLLHIAPGEVDPVRAFHFSGHGGRSMDKDGDEPDRIDEVLCLPSYDWRDPNSFILDDEIQVLLNRDELNNRIANLFVTFDSCHSGTATKAIDVGWPDIEERFVFDNGLTIESASVDWKVEDILPIYSVTRETSDSPPVIESMDSGTGYSTAKPQPTNHLLLSGCTSAQTCKDVPIAGTYHGIFTYVMANAIAAQPEISWSTLQQIVSDATSDQFNQDIQLDGPEDLKNRKVFK